MAHPSLVINQVQYANVPQIQVPKVGGGTATFYDASDETITSGDVLSGKKGIGASGEVTGNISSKSAASYNPSTSDQTINSGQYLSGNQTIRAVTISGLSSAVIANGVTVKIGCSADDDCVASYTGSLSAAVISQDSTTKVLSIS